MRKVPLEMVLHYLMLNVKRLENQIQSFGDRARPHLFIRGISWKEKMLKLKLGHQEIDIYRSRSHTTDWNGKNE